MKDKNEDNIDKFIWALNETERMIKEGMQTSYWDYFAGWNSIGFALVSEREKANTKPK